jgi:arylsulfatase A-like enzyme
MLGFLAMGVANSIAGALRVRAPLDARIWFHVYDLLHFVLLGLASTAIAAGARRATKLAHAELLAASAAALMVGVAVLTPDLRGPAARMQASTGVSGLAPLLAVATASLVPAAYFIGERIGRTRARHIAALLPIVTGPVNLVIFTQLLPGAHLFLAWGSAAFLAGAYRRTSIPVWPRSLQARRLLGGAAVALAGLAVAVPPPPRGGTMMGQVSGSVLYPFTSRIHAARVRSWLPEQMPDGPWYRERTNLPATSATQSLTESPSIVILISIDAMRADILTNPAFQTAMPRLAALRDRSIFFGSAWAPSNATVSSLTTLFTGRYYSQLYWTPLEDDPGGGEELWPHADESPRFPELLSGAGIRTVTYAPAYWLMNRFGVVRGFDDEDYIVAKKSVGPRHSSRWASAKEVTARVRKRLRWIAKAPSRRTFFFVHLLEPHYPYDQGDNDSEDDFSRYLTELTVADSALGDVLDTIDDLGIRERTAVVVTADHGEAFGEHGTTRHGSTLYDEIVRVPLVMYVPGLERQAIDTPVSLVDVGPTILDLYGVATPASFMGESLVPLMQGEDISLTRPLVIEGRPKQAMVFSDGMKVIRDLRLGLLEAYDLREDPTELENLYDGWVRRFDDYFGPLAAFFHVHEIQREGYDVRGR